jgi:hypothetical protein
MISWRERKAAGLAAFDTAMRGEPSPDQPDAGVAAFRAAVKGDDPGIAAFRAAKNADKRVSFDAFDAAMKGEPPNKFAAFDAALASVKPKNADVRVEMTEANQPPGKIGTPKEESDKFVREHPELYGNFREPTLTESAKSGAASAVAGAGEGMASAITMPIDVGIDNITAGPLRRFVGASKKFLTGEEVKPEDVQPPMPLTGLASEAATDAQATFKRWLGVPPEAITDVPDAIIRTTSMLMAGGKAAEGISGLLGRGKPPMQQVVAKATAPNPVGPPPSEPWSLPARDSSEFAQALRIIPVGERDIHMAEANQLRDGLARIVPKATDQEAMTLMRDFKGDPSGLERFLDGNHEAYAGMDVGAKAEAMDRVEHLRPIIERAMDPTPEMQQADGMLDKYFGKTLDEGRNAGTLDSNVDPNEYITHLLQPKEPRAVKATGSGLRYTKWSRNTPFSKSRAYPTVLHAVADGVEPRTLNAFDALSIYGERHGTAIGMRTLVNTLKESDLAKFGSGPGKNIPADWEEVGAGTRIFRNEVPYTDAEGEPQVAHQALYAPKDIADAIRPLTDPDWTNTIPGFRNTKMYQAYIKSAELSLSLFHVGALNITAFGNMGIEGMLKSYAGDMRSPTFLNVEQTFVRHGGQTSILGRTAEAIRATRETSIPTRLDVIRNLPVLKQFEKAGAATAKLTFDIIQRKFKVTDFAIKDAKWIAEHSTASPIELASARRAIAKEINGAYGGLNWEVLGVSKAHQSLLRGLFLAPDWTFSNWVNLKTAFAGGPGGAAARAFWLRSAVGGVAATQIMSKLISGKMSDDPTQVYMGKDSKGKDVYQNMFFAGAPSDLVNLIKNVQDFGPLGGTARTLANKLSPFLRAGLQQVENTDFMGRPITIRGASPLTNLARSAKHAASQTLPVPFSASNIEQMLTDPKNEYSPEEYITTILRGTRPRHVPPENVREAQRRRAQSRAQHK